MKFCVFYEEASDGCDAYLNVQDYPFKMQHQDENRWRSICDHYLTEKNAAHIANDLGLEHLQGAWFDLRTLDPQSDEYYPVDFRACQEELRCVLGDLPMLLPDGVTWRIWVKQLSPIETWKDPDAT